MKRKTLFLFYNIGCVSSIEHYNKPSLIICRHNHDTDFNIVSSLLQVCYRTVTSILIMFDRCTNTIRKQYPVVLNQVLEYG